MISLCYCCDVGNRENSISVKLVGGLGNQLFCYFAGYDLSVRKSCSLDLDVTDIRSGISTHSVSIESFALPGNFFSTKSEGLIKKAKLKNLLVRVSRKLNFPITFSRRTYISNVIGFDENVMKVDPGSSLYGYFQTYRHFFPYRQDFHNVSLKAPSRWFEENLSKMKSENAVAIHVRRGDYSKLADTYGLLSADYYKHAVDAISGHLPNSIFWVFSDDPEVARLLLADILPKNTVWVIPPSDHDAAETMLLMSNASGNVIANSTFSWWGAALNSSGGPVVAPSKWFKLMLDPKDLYPPHWTQVESSWVN